MSPLIFGEIQPPFLILQNRSVKQTSTKQQVRGVHLGAFILQQHQYEAWGQKHAPLPPFLWMMEAILNNYDQLYFAFAL